MRPLPQLDLGKLPEVLPAALSGEIGCAQSAQFATFGLEPPSLARGVLAEERHENCEGCENVSGVALGRHGQRHLPPIRDGFNGLFESVRQHPKNLSTPLPRGKEQP